MYAGGSSRSRSMHICSENKHSGKFKIEKFGVDFFFHPLTNSHTHTHMSMARAYAYVVSKGSQDIYRTEQCFIYTGKIGISRYVCFCLLAELTISYISVNVAVFGGYVCVRVCTYNYLSFISTAEGTRLCVWTH